MAGALPRLIGRYEPSGVSQVSLTFAPPSVMKEQLGRPICLVGEPCFLWCRRCKSGSSDAGLAAVHRCPDGVHRHLAAA